MNTYLLISVQGSLYPNFDDNLAYKSDIGLASKTNMDGKHIITDESKNIDQVLLKIQPEFIQDTLRACFHSETNVTAGGSEQKNVVIYIELYFFCIM